MLQTTSISTFCEPSASVPNPRMLPVPDACSHNPIDAGEPDVSMFGVFDGHGGDFTSKFVAQKLKKCLLTTPGWTSGDR